MSQGTRHWVAPLLICLLAGCAAAGVPYTLAPDLSTHPPATIGVAPVRFPETMREQPGANEAVYDLTMAVLKALRDRGYVALRPGEFDLDAVHKTLDGYRRDPIEGLAAVLLVDASEEHIWLGTSRKTRHDVTFQLLEMPSTALLWEASCSRQSNTIKSDVEARTTLDPKEAKAVDPDDYLGGIPQNTNWARFQQAFAAALAECIATLPERPVMKIE